MRILAAALLAALSAPGAVFAQASGNLRGISVVGVAVSLSAQDLPSSITTERLRTLVEFRLRDAGLRVVSLSEDSVLAAVSPYVDLSVLILRARNSYGGNLGYAFATSVSIKRLMYVSSLGTGVPLELWERSFINLAGTSDAAAQIERVITVALDDLLNQWLAANRSR